MKICLNLSVFLLWISTILTGTLHFSHAERSFVINYEENSFYKDGKPFQYMSGSVHYFRMPNKYWRDRLRKLRAAGLTAVSTYVEWSQHEFYPGIFRFVGDLDLMQFIRIAQEEDLLVILRPGPYICAERDMGGLPYWLLTEKPNIELRTMDPVYLRYVERWLNVLMHKLEHYLYGRGGPIIMVQVENEYGSYYSCDYNYTIWLRDLFKSHIQDDAVLFTTDGASGSYLKCGKIPGVYATVDFGPNSDVKKMFQAQRQYEPKGPLVNSEYYTGWLTHWGEKSMARQPTTAVIKTLREMLDEKANVNFYMFYGGTNFGFTAGANMMSTYQSDVTSYDYDAPISEAGDLTDKYKAIKDTLTEYFGPPPNITVKALEKGDYGTVTLHRVGTLLSRTIRKNFGFFVPRFKYPPTFEAVFLNYGYLLYETEVEMNLGNITTSILTIDKVRDYANVYVDGYHIGSMSRENDTTRLKITQPGRKLSILVENLGRINFGSHINDRKGILSEVLLNGNSLQSWNVTLFKFEEVYRKISECFVPLNWCDGGGGFALYSGDFRLSENNETPLDTFIDVRNLTKGLIFVNDVNLGRYWSSRGPQYTLYVPGIYLHPYPVTNTIVLMDENVNSDNIQINFIKTPIGV